MNPDDRIIDYMEEKSCPDFIPKEEGSVFCLHDTNDGWCTLSKYFNCIIRESQELNPKPNPNPKAKSRGKSKAKPAAEGDVAPVTPACDPVGRFGGTDVILSYSSCQDFSHCHRKYWWSRQIEPIEKSLALLKGSCGHEILQYIYTAEQPELAGITAIVDKYQDLFSPSSTSDPSPGLELLKALGWAYLELNAEKLFKGKPEVHWEFEKDGVKMQGYLDLVQYEEGGE